MPARKSAPLKPTKPAKPTAAPHDPPEGQGKPARSKAAKPAKKAPAKKQKPAAPRKPGGAAALSPRHQLFVAEYLKDQNASQAAIRAGYRGAPDVVGPRLLGYVRVRAAVDEAIAAIRQRAEKNAEISLTRTLREIARGAFHDPRKFFDAGGNLKAVTSLDDDTASALAAFDVSELGHGDDAIGTIKKIKLADRKGYLDMLMKHFGAYEKDNKQQGQGTAEALRDLMASLHGGAARLPIARNPGKP
jgi:phage terminase small subunit